MSDALSVSNAPRVFLLGAGRAGRSVAVALGAAGVPVAGLHGRARPLPAAVADADVILVATPDTAIDATLVELAAAELVSTAVVLHMSGARAPDATDAALRARIGGVGTFHPLVPLAVPELGADRLRGAWVGIGGDARAVEVGHSLARIVGAHPLRIPDGSEARARYHAAAVFASNFPVVLAAVAERLFRDAGVERDGALGAVRHLLASAAANVELAASPEGALTGPVARGDVATVERHIAALATDAEASALYRVLARATLDLARQPNAANAPGLDAIAALLQ